MEGMMIKTISYTAAIFTLIFVLYGNTVSAEGDLRGGSTTTDYSGRDKSQKNSFTKPESNNDAIYGISMGERSDDPCFLKIKYRDVASGAESSKTYNECSGKEKSVKLIDLTQGAFVTGIRVCLNSAKDKVKGIQLIGNYAACTQGADTVTVDIPPCSPVTKTGSSEYRLCNKDGPTYKTLNCSNLGYYRPDNYYERTNCQGLKSKNGPDSDWEEAVYCPTSRHVATGMKLNTREGGGKRRMITGIALVCHTLVDS